MGRIQSLSVLKHSLTCCALGGSICFWKERRCNLESCPVQVGRMQLHITRRSGQHANLMGMSAAANRIGSYLLRILLLKAYFPSVDSSISLHDGKTFLNSEPHLNSLLCRSQLANQHFISGTCFDSYQPQPAWTAVRSDESLSSTTSGGVTHPSSKG